MKKVLFILPWLEIGGMERMQVTLANALSRLGYEVTIMTLQQGDALRKQLEASVRFIYREPKRFSIMRRIPYIRHKFYDDGMWETRASAKALYQYYVGAGRYDIEIAFFRGLPVKIISGSTNPMSVKIAWVHSDFKKCMGVQNNFCNMKAAKEAYAKFNHIVCVSKQACKSFVDVIGVQDKTTIIYNLLPIDEIKELSCAECKEDKTKFTILSVGRLVYAKGYDRLLSVIKRLNEEGYVFEQWIIGTGNEEETLKQYASENQLDNVHFLGQQLNPYCYMKEADLYVCSSRYEGYNLTVAESLICGTPVLSTECTGPCEILGYGEYGMVVDNNEEGLYQGIKMFLEQPKLLQEYQKRAVQRCNFFDENKILNQVIKLFK